VKGLWTGWEVIELEDAEPLDPVEAQYALAVVGAEWTRAKIGV
jgi:hypothetical protein